MPPESKAVLRSTAVPVSVVRVLASMTWLFAESIAIKSEALIFEAVKIISSSPSPLIPPAVYAVAISSAVPSI